MKRLFHFRLKNVIYNKVKLVPERKQKNVVIYSSAGEWKYSVESLYVENPPVATDDIVKLAASNQFIPKIL